MPFLQVATYLPPADVLLRQSSQTDAPVRQLNRLMQNHPQLAYNVSKYQQIYVNPSQVVMPISSYR
jgi:hypothetical protein